MKRLVVWGGRESLDSIRHVLRHYFDNACKLGIPAVWLPNTPASARQLDGDDTILAVDVAGDQLPYLPDASYVLHNFSGDSPLCVALEDTPEKLLRLQVYTDSAAGEVWGPCRRFDLEARTLFQPWGIDVLREEFYEPVFNPAARTVPFIGAIWRDTWNGVELGNEDIIAEVREACRRCGLAFRHLTHITDGENVAAVRAGRLAPAFAGEWQVRNNYVPCRPLKTAAYGALPLTNVPVVLDLLQGAALYGSPGEVIDQALGMGQTQYLNLVREAQRAVAGLTYRESLEAISRAFEEMRG